LVRVEATGFDVTIDGCIFTQTRGQVMRTSSSCRVVKVTNSIFANLGDLILSNFGAGKGIDLRDASCDTLLVKNTTFVNFQDRIIRHLNSTGSINNLIFDHNTIMNGMSYHGTLALGWTGESAQITNNLFYDHFVAGNDSDATRQSEFNESNELDRWGFSAMYWVVSVPNDSTTWTVSNNYYGVSPEVQAFYDSVGAVDDAFTGAGNPLTHHINTKVADSTTAFTSAAFTFGDIPVPPVAMAKWYRTPIADGGAGKTKDKTNFVRATDDFDRVPFGYLDATFDAGYDDDSPAATGSTDGGQVGDLNWSLNQVSALRGTDNQHPNSFVLGQNYPNPFNPSTSIDFAITVKEKVTLEVFNIAGQKVSTLVNNTLTPGQYTADWNAASFSSGVYFYKLTQGSSSSVKKMILVK
jgi:hypothetical protein